MEIKDVLFDLRQKCNLTQDELAEKLFVTRQAVSRWENGGTIPNIDTLRLISSVFGVSINSLLDAPYSNDNTDFQNAEINADRFLGFADIYENARPKMPLFPVEIMTNYLGNVPDTVVDLGCGTGLSTLIWQGRCNKIIGVEPSEDMLLVARLKTNKNTSFVKAFSHETGIESSSSDIVICSQSFHWMNPQQTLGEVNRILKTGGIFGTVDCDWPPVCNWKIENEYNMLFNKVHKIENEYDDVKVTFHRWDKNNHLENIKSSGHFRYCREIVFSNTEKCDSDRLVSLALSQGSLQTILKIRPELIENDVNHFRKIAYQTFCNDEFDIKFNYRMRIGVK